MMLKEIRGKPFSRQERIDTTVELAAKLFKESQAERTWKERQKERWLSKMMRDPDGRLFMTEMADLLYRSSSAPRVIDQLIDLIARMGVPRFLGDGERIGLLMLKWFGRAAPHLFLFLMKKKMERELESVLLPKRGVEQKGVTVNLNHLGEAILGEEEAERRLASYLEALADPQTTYMSIKISTLYSQINLYAFKESLNILAERLRTLYRACSPHQFINLDMEAYRDLDLTIALFKKVLGEPEFHQMRGGIVLQAYLPESYTLLQELTRWAKRRGGAPIKIRIVKGANLAMEQIESSIKGWRQAPFERKEESDANFKRMLEYAIHPERTRYVEIGVGSHNLFDIAYALILRAETATEQAVSFEMLRGMAPGLQRVLLKEAGSLTLYCPKASAGDFKHALPYLIRRLDENGSPENFLRHFFHLKPESATWQQEEGRFRSACMLIDTLPTARRRQTPCHPPFEPDTDFALAENRTWRPKKRTFKEQRVQTRRDVDALFKRAKPHQASLDMLPDLFRAARHELIEIVVNTVGKPVQEADSEVSEAIDFLTYYQQIWRPIGAPKGTVLVASPWNFSIAIPVSGIAASLITGNSVLFKPAPEARTIGRRLAELFWEAGVSKEALQFLHCEEETTGDYLIQHPELSSVILTGATATARHFMQLRPTLDLMAETGGKNCMIVTAMADRDLAIRDTVHSAFSYAGQKCSACSLLILEQELYNDPDFLRQLKDAAASLPVGPSLRATTVVPPLIHRLNPAYLRLDPGESWLLEPKKVRGHPNLWSPGIKLGVRPGSYTHQTEFFAPLLGVMSAESVEEAIALANGTPYGLTAGLHTLDRREQAVWREKIVAGNLYINRNMVGALVGRQPFGGCKASAFGPGAKVGGPNYLKQLMHVESFEDGKREALPGRVVPLLTRLALAKDEQQILKRSVESYAYWHKVYTTPQEMGHVSPGQQNLFYARPKERVVVRYRGEPTVDLLRVLAALEMCNTPYDLSEASEIPEVIFLEAMDATPVRLLSPSKEITERAAEVGAFVMAQPVHASGEFELLHYLREISLSFDYHRYGYVGRSQFSTDASGQSC